ncbi:MAG TPA: MMPL family transporter, partial [Geobacteraceae bacterium]
RRLLVPEAEAFAARLQALQVDGQPAFAKITYRIYDPAEKNAFADFLAYAALHPQLFLGPDETENFAARFSPPNAERFLRRATTELASQAGMGMRDIIAADPLYLRELILPRLKRGSQALDLDPASPYFLSRDGQVLIMIAEPARPVQNMAFARKLVAGIDRARQGAKVHISCTGAHLSAVIDEKVMKGNIIASILSSLVIVLGLFYLTYRRVLPTLLIPLILFCGVALALGTAGLFLSSVNIISFAFTALIIGLGTDYSIHLYDRFYSERYAGRSTDEALRLAVVHTGYGVFTAAATTALPFLALAVSDVRALFELGILVGLGVIFSLYATFFFLPPLLLYSERRFPNMRYTPLPTFALGGVWNIAHRHGRLVRWSATLVTLALFGAAFAISFEGELKNLQPRHSEAFLTQEKIERHLSLSPRQMLVAVEGKNLPDVLARGSRVEELAEKYRRSGEISSFSSLGQVLNDSHLQEEVARRLSRHFAAASPDQELRNALARSGFDTTQFGPLITGVAALKDAHPVPLAEAIERLSASPLRGVVNRHLIRDAGGNYHLLFYLFYKGEEFRQDTFLRELASAAPEARATSVDLVSNQLAASVKRSFAWGILLGGALVLFLLVSHFDSLAGVLFSLVPVMAGVVAMLGIMALTSQRINFMNAMVLVTILGMGSDYGLHIYYRAGGPGGDEKRTDFVQAGRAVFLSALTTIAGFGSLAFTDYGAMSSIGWATNYGVGMTALLALVAVPAFMALMSPGRK